MAKRRRRTHDYAEEPLQKPYLKPVGDPETDTQSDHASPAGNILQLHQSRGNQYVMRVLGKDTATLSLKDAMATHLAPRFQWPRHRAQRHSRRDH